MEIGVAGGHTFKQMMQMPQIERCIGVDIKPVDFVVSGLNEFYQMSSQEFAKVWKDPIDMLFIDGDHNKETVEHDFFEIGKFVRPGTGLILMHDTHPMTEELLKPEFCNNAWEFADLIFSVSTFKYEVITLPGPWAGITLVRKRGKHHLCWKDADG